MTIDSSLKDAGHKMEQAVSHLKEDLAGIRTGRASPAVLNRVTVEYYGTPVPLNQLASITRAGAAAPGRHALRQERDRRRSRRRSSRATSGSRRRTTGR